LAVCPKCGNEVLTPVKTWSVPSRHPSQQNQTVEIAVGIFECPKCTARFRAAVDYEKKTEMGPSIKDMVDRIKGIQGELLQTLKSLREKIKTLETERSDLMIEIDSLRKVAESRATALEDEVGMLREELKSLRELLSYPEETEKP
jgi:uncharacterized protein YlxW (UPF0749 family)